jgi:hypothetical protein
MMVKKDLIPGTLDLTQDFPGSNLGLHNKITVKSSFEMPCYLTALVRKLLQKYLKLKSKNFSSALDLKA